MHGCTENAQRSTQSEQRKIFGSPEVRPPFLEKGVPEPPQKRLEKEANWRVRRYALRNQLGGHPR